MSFCRIGVLCSGNHAASATLKRARTKLGFHWDADVIKTSVAAFGRNSRIVWFEADSGFRNTVQRLGVEVMGHALFHEIDAETDTERAHADMSRQTVHVDEAANDIQTLFLAAIFGYMRRCGAVGRTR